jgi:hypothetical protein
MAGEYKRPPGSSGVAAADWGSQQHFEQRLAAVIDMAWNYLGHIAADLPMARAELLLRLIEKQFDAADADEFVERMVDRMRLAIEERAGLARGG